MSQDINSVEYRKNVIKDLLQQLHEGKSVDEVKEQFAQAFAGVSAVEIAEAEKVLVAEGMPVEEIMRLCDVHAAVFKGSIEEVHGTLDFSQTPGHPAHTLKAENRAIERLIEESIRPGLRALAEGKQSPKDLLKCIETLQAIDIHYLRKENLFFSYLERHGVTAPPKVMWGVDDEIREHLKEAVLLAKTNAPSVAEKLEEALVAIEEMIFKEEQILLPMMFDTLKLQEWKDIADQSDELGYCLIEKPVTWGPAKLDVDGKTQDHKKFDVSDQDQIVLPSGVFSIKELTHVLNTLPFDITFVGKDDKVRYFSETDDRIFPRARAIIGREVSNCHPPASVHIVEDIIADFKQGKKSHEDFWISMGDKYVLIRYFAVRDENDEYLGVVEVTQDIVPLQKITGEKRLVSEKEST